MPPPPLLLLQDIRPTFGGTPLLEGATLSLGPGERVCLVGRNGSGKSTLLKIAAGLVEPDGGERFLKPGATVRYLPQEPDLAGFPTVLAYAEAGLAPGDDRYRARYLLESLGLDPETSPASLSGGETRRAALARALAPEPDILLLDEPTNHLDLLAIEALEQSLNGMSSALVLISHDRRFLEDLSEATVWLDRGRTLRLDQGFGAFEVWRDRVLEEEETQRHKLDRKIVNEEHWLRYGVTARRKRNQRRLGGLFALRAERKRSLANRSLGSVTAAAQEARASGALVIEAERISKSYGERPIVSDFSMRIERGDRVGIIGANGAGKTTLLNLLTGALAPDSGLIRLGSNLVMASLDQKRESIDANATLADVLTEGRGDYVTVGEEKRHVVGYMRDFLFRPEQARTPVRALSGGERGRLILARALARPSNLLVLDEPTNDLDLETLDVLEEVLADYRGTVLLVSHDRDFLDRTVSSVIADEGGGKWLEYAGGYSDLLAQRGYGVAAQKPAAAPPSQPAQAKERRETNQPKKKLTFNDQQALKTLPHRMERLAADIHRLEAELADASLYRTDPTRFATSSQALERARTELSGLEEEWLRIELLREEIEGA